MNCPNQIPNPIDCSCRDVPDCAGYTDLWSSYESIQAWYLSLKTYSASIEAALENLKSLFYSMAVYCTSNPVNTTYVSLNYVIIQNLINDLTFNVNAFKSTLKPNTSCPNPPTCDYAYYVNENNCLCTCSLECDTDYQFFNFRLCDCSNFSCAGELYKLQKLIPIAIKNASSHIINSDAASNYTQQLADLYQQVNTLVSYMEFYEYLYAPGDLCAAIAALSQQFDNETTIYNQKKLDGVCSESCLPNEIQCIDCSCVTSPEITTFMESYGVLLNNLTIIYGYEGYGDQGQLEVVFSLVANTSMWYNSVYKNISNHCSGLDVIYINEQTGLLVSATASVNTTWTDFINADNPCSVAALDCTGVGNITDSGNCQCTYDDCMASLPDVLAYIPGYINEINDLTLDATNKGILLENW